MEIILKETIDTLGQEGEIVKVKPGYARNYLIPQNKAVLVDKASLARLEKEQQAIAARLEEQTNAAEKLAGKLEGKVITINRRVGEEDRLFGSVTNSDIADSLKENGVAIDRKNIQLSEPIKAVGEYKVAIKTGYQKLANITVLVAPEETEEQE